MLFELGPDKLQGLYEIDYNRFVITIDEHVISWNCIDWDKSPVHMTAEEIWNQLGEAVMQLQKIL